MLRSSRTGSYGRYIVIFLRICHTYFITGRMSLQSHQQQIRAPYYPYALHNLLSVVLVTFVILMAVR